MIAIMIMMAMPVKGLGIVTYYGSDPLYVPLSNVNEYIYYSFEIQNVNDEDEEVSITLESNIAFLEKQDYIIKARTSKKITITIKLPEGLDYKNGCLINIWGGNDMETFIKACLIGIFIWAIVMCLCGCNSQWTWPGQESTQVVTPPSSQQQLWQTVKKSNWLVTLAIPIIALGAVAKFNGAAKLGMSAVIFGAVNLFMALATARFALWMSIFGLIGSGLAVTASILSKNKALVEIIKGVQDYRRGKIEHDDLDTKLKAAQKSSTTQKIVQVVKTKLKLKGEI